MTTRAVPCVPRALELGGTHWSTFKEEGEG